MRPINGLYLLRLVAPPPRDTAQRTTDGDPDAPGCALPKDTEEGRSQCSSSGASSTDGALRVLCRLRFHGSRAGSISGNARLVSGATRRRVRLGADGTWCVDDEGLKAGLTFSLHLDAATAAAAAEVANGVTDGPAALAKAPGSADVAAPVEPAPAPDGEASPLDASITLRFSGTLNGRAFVGSVSTFRNNVYVATPFTDRRVFMSEVTGVRCARCCDPVGLGPGRCASGCGSLDYCSEDCRSAHAPALSLVTDVIPRYVGSKAAQCSASFDGKEFAVFWRAVGPLTFNVLVLPCCPLQVAYEIRLDVLIDARLGTSLAFISGDETSVDRTALIAQNNAVMEAVVHSAISRGCVALAAASLNHLFTWCDYIDTVEQLYMHFYDTCGSSGWEAQAVISTLGEYVMLVRPIFECATVLIEAALKASLASGFWFCVESAKGVLITLYNLNSSVNFTPAALGLRTTFVVEQQRQTLLLLARAFVMMAMRTPQEHSAKVLRRAEECYRDALDEDRCRNNYLQLGQSYLRLAALYLMFPEQVDRDKAKKMREEGLKSIAKGLQGFDNEATNQTMRTILSMVTQEAGRAAAAAVPHTIRKIASAEKDTKGDDAATAVAA